MTENIFLTGKLMFFDKCVNNVLLYTLQHTLTNTHKLSTHKWSDTKKKKRD